MKNIPVTLLMLAALAMGVSAKPVASNLANQVEAAVAQAALADVHDDAVVDMVLTVESKWANPLNEASAAPMTRTKPCSAVRIDKSWLMASLSCRGVGRYVTALDHNNNSYTKEIAYRQIIKAEVRSGATHQRDKITPDRIFVDEEAQIILLNLNAQDADLMSEMQNVKVAPILIPSNPAAVKDNMDDAYINRERNVLPGRCSDCVGIDSYCTDNQCYKLEWELTDGDAGDPLFVVKAKNEFLAGFNNAEIVGDHPKSGKTYRGFTAGTRAALEKILKNRDSAAWTRVKGKIKTAL